MSYNFTVTRKKVKQELLTQVGAEFGEWIESTLGEPLPPPGASNLFEVLKNGVVLCALLNTISPGAVKIRPPTSPFAAAENVQAFLKACPKVGIKESSLFEVNDLLNLQNGLKVVQTLEALRSITDANPTVPLKIRERQLSSPVIELKEGGDAEKLLARKKQFDDAEAQRQPSQDDGETRQEARVEKDAKKQQQRELEEQAERERQLTEEREAAVRERREVEERIARQQAEKEREQEEAKRKQRELAEQAEQGKEQAENEAKTKELAERDKIEDEQAERERVESEKVQKEQAEKERVESERAEEERAESEKAEKERAEKERAEKERAESEKAQKERAEKERAEREEAEKEKNEKDRAEKEQAEKEQAEREQAEREQAEKERAEREQAEKERAEKEQAEKEQAEKERIESVQEDARAEKSGEEQPSTPPKANGQEEDEEVSDEETADSDQEQGTEEPFKISRQPLHIHIENVKTGSKRSSGGSSGSDDAWGIYKEAHRKVEDGELGSPITPTAGNGSDPSSPSSVHRLDGNEEEEQQPPEPKQPSGPPPIPPRPNSEATLDNLEAQNSPDFEEQEPIKSGTKVRAVYGFEKRGADELSFVEDDVIVVTSGLANGAWWFGEMSGQTGWFPANHVEVLTSASKRTWFKKYQNEKSDGMTQNEKLQALMQMNQKSATLPSRFRKPAPLASSPTSPTAAAAAPPPNLATLDSPLRRTLPAKSSSSSANRRSQVMSMITTSSAAEAERWKDQVSQETYEGLTEMERQRQEVIFELVRTEREYVRDLGIIIDVFLQPVRTKKLLGPKEILALFSSVEQLKPVNEELLKLLEGKFQTNPVVEQVGDVFVTMAEYLKIYKSYCRKHPYSLLEYQKVKADPKFKKFRQHEEECFKKPECRMLDLQSFLLKPVQRICKYPLLIREILKYTEENHVDRQNLDKAYSNIQAIVQIVNEATKEEANMRRIVEIQKKTEKLDILTVGRRLLFEDQINAVDQEGKKKEDGLKSARTLYLFNDLLLVTKFKDKERLTSEVVAKILLEDLSMKDVPESEEIRNAIHFTQRPKNTAGPFSSKDFRLLAVMKDEETKRKFMTEWEEAEKSKNEDAYSFDSLPRPSERSGSFRTESGDNEPQIIHEIDPPSPPDFTPFERVEGVNAYDLVLLPNTQSHGTYKSSKHLLMMVKVQTNQGEHVVYKTIEDALGFAGEMKKITFAEFPKQPLACSSLVKVDAAWSKLAEFNTFLNEILKLAFTDEQKALLAQFLSTNSASV